MNERIESKSPTAPSSFRVAHVVGQNLYKKDSERYFLYVMCRNCIVV